MAAPPNEDLKLVPKETNYLISGYIRESDIKDVAEVIIQIIVSYIFEIGDYFAIIGEGVQISGIYKNKPKYAKVNRKGKWATAYGNIIIDPQTNLIYEWTFKIGGEVTGIGIISVGNRPDPTYFAADDWNSAGKYYGFVNTPYRQNLWNSKIGGGWNDFDGFEKGDIIKMSINTKKGTMRYYRNDQYKVILFGPGNITNTSERDTLDWSYKYRLVVSLQRVTRTIELIKFESFPGELMMDYIFYSY